MFAYTFKPVSNHRRYLYQNRIVCTCNKLIYLSKSRGIFPFIIKNNLHHTMYNSKMVCLYLMIMPCLYNTRISCRYIYLTKFQEKFVIFSKYLHQSATLIGDWFEFFYLYAINHGHFPLYFLFYSAALRIILKNKTASRKKLTPSLSPPQRNNDKNILHLSQFQIPY